MRNLWWNTVKLGLVCCVLLMSACRKDGPEESSQTIKIQSGKKVLIGNEGNFQFGNSSLSLYQFSDSSVTHDLFSTTNKRSLGDVCQSLAVSDEKIFAVINNSGKVEVISRTDFSSLGTIEGFRSPRYLEVISRNSAYVSDYKANAIYKVDLGTFKISDSIPIDSWTEGMITIGSKLLVCGKSKDYVYQVNLESDQLVDSIKVGSGPTNLVVDQNNKVWCLCEGNYGSTGDIQLVRINPHSFEVEKQFNFDAGINPTCLRVSPDGDRLFFLHQGIYSMWVTDEQLPQEPVVDLVNHNLYCLAIDFSNSNLWVTDAKDYISRSEVLVLDVFGNELFRFGSGVNSSSFLMLY